MLWKSGIQPVAQAAHRTARCSRSRRPARQPRLGCRLAAKGRPFRYFPDDATRLGDYDTTVAPDSAAVDAIGRDLACRRAWRMNNENVIIFNGRTKTVVVINLISANSRIYLGFLAIF